MHYIWTAIATTLLVLTSHGFSQEIDASEYEVLVRFENATSSEAIPETYGEVQVIRKELISGCRLYLLVLRTTQPIDDVIKALIALPEIELAELNQEYDPGSFRYLP